MSLLESFAETGSLLTVATTHHGELKTLKYRLDESSKLESFTWIVQREIVVCFRSLSRSNLKFKWNANSLSTSENSIYNLQERLFSAKEIWVMFL